MTTQMIAVLGASLLTPVALFASELPAIVDFQVGYLLGGAGAKGKWVTAEALTKSKTLPGARRYRIYSASRYLGEVSGGKAASTGAPCSDTQFVEFSPSSESAAYKTGAIAIGGSWNALPRVPRVESTTQAVYRNVVAGLLRSKGMPKATVRIAQIYRVDLEGDGVAEVLINATNHQGSNGLSGSINSNSRAGEYSMIVLRKIVKGKVQTSVLESAFYPQDKTFNAPSVFKILGAFDVNGDGKMEIVTKGRYYEGDWTTVYTVAGGQPGGMLKVREVLSEGCGA